MRSDADAGALLERVRSGEARALARAITAVESGDVRLRRAAMAARWPTSARVIGLSGPPGVGKSTLANALGQVLADAGERVAVVAVDPSSPKTGGALLGDRARLAGDDGRVFFRSMAARGELGGLAPEVEPVLRLLALSGRGRILLETVGAGQGEHAVTRLADLTLAILAPGLGDAVQAAKAGLFEVADAVVVNQADRPEAEATAALWRATRASDAAPVALVSAREGTGVSELAEAVAGLLAAGSPRDRSPAPADRDPLRATRLHHIGLAVSDGDASAALWRSLLGLEEVSRHRVDEFGVQALFLGPTAVAQAGLLELVQPTAPGPVSRFLDRRGPGLHHVCFEVEDIHAALGALAARGVRLVDETPRVGAGGHLVAFVHPSSAGGVLLELKQVGRSSRR